VASAAATVRAAAEAGWHGSDGRAGYRGRVAVAQRMAPRGRRELHVALDEALAEACGWGDLRLGMDGSP
jgi:hypothetical protein